MNVDRRVWWGVGALVVGLGAALLTGSGIAAAHPDDSGGAGAGGGHSTTAAGGGSSRSGATSVAASRPHDAGPTTDAQTAADIEAVLNRHTTLKLMVVPIASAADVEGSKVSANPVHLHGVEPGVANHAGPNPSPPAGAHRASLAATPLIVGQTIAATRGEAAPVAYASPLANSSSRPGLVATLVLSLLSGLGPSRTAAMTSFPARADWSRPVNPSAVDVALVATAVAQTVLSQAALAQTNGVTGVKVGHSLLKIPCGPGGYTARADWYFPTQADGSVQAVGVIWLQHGFLLNKWFYSKLATTLAQQTDSIVVVPTLTSNPLACAGCWLNGVPMQKAVANMFVGNRADLNISANAAGYQGTLPDKFVLTGHSAGGGFTAAVAGYTVDNGAAANLLGVVMFDGVSSNGTFSDALAKLATRDIPMYQIAAPPQAWNAFGTTTDELIAARPGQFVGVVLVNGSHVDAMLGRNPIADFLLQLITKRSPPGNTAAVYTLATGWINDMYVGTGPTEPEFGIYGQAGQPIILGPAAAIILPAQPAATGAPVATRTVISV
ncbi:MAG TPA: lipocalin [Mycobacterium sp.]|nr:lipocalin [Mycobacterium sp.]